MKPTRLFFILLCLCLLVGCGGDMARPAAEDHPPVHVTYTPDPNTVPAELLESLPDPVGTPAPDPKEAALLYAGERVSLYRAYRNGAPGICVEELQWANTNMFYQELPGTKGLPALKITDIEIVPIGKNTEGQIYVHYLDDAEGDRIVCFEAYSTDWGRCYPLSYELGLKLSEGQQRLFNDLLLIGYYYSPFELAWDNLSDPVGWESRCQRRILDLLYNHWGDALPPYLTGEGTYDDELQDTAIVSQKELESFFQSTVGRPNLVPDRVHEDEDLWPDLLPGQVPVPPTDWNIYAHAKQAIEKPDGSVWLYGYVGGEDGFYHAMLICHLSPVEGFMGYRVESTEVYPVENVTNDSTVTFTP